MILSMKAYKEGIMNFIIVLTTIVTSPVFLIGMTGLIFTCIVEYKPKRRNIK